MDKILKITKYILLLILTILTTKFITVYKEIGISLLIYLIELITLIIINIKDEIKKNKIRNSATYNTLSIITLAIIIFIFMRTLYDPLLINNSKEYINELIEEQNSYNESKKIYNMLYLYQNIIYFIILFILLFTYRKINMEKQESKYHWVTLLCLVIRITSTIPSIEVLYSNSYNVITYGIINIILIGTEIYRLIKDNHKKNEWPIYISWLFNLFAIISIIVNIIISNKI